MIFLTTRMLLSVALLLAVSMGGSVTTTLASSHTSEVNFGSVILGDVGTRAVFVSVTQGVTETWQRLYDPSSPITNTTPSGPVPIADTFAFIFTFQPMVGGNYVDSTAIVRFENDIAVDTLIVLFSGEGRSLSADAEIRYSTTMIGDFVVRTRNFFGPAYIVNQYIVVRRPQAPFLTSLVNDKPTVDPPDSIRVGVAFEPVNTGTYVDTLVMVRELSAGIPLDTLRIALEGTSAALKPDTTVAFTGVTLGMVDTMFVFFRLPAPFVSRSFQYEITSLDTGPLRAEVDPTNPSRRTLIATRIIAAPSEFKNVRQRFLLRRKSEQTGQVWDSTLITIDLIMSPRPVSYRLEWTKKPINARIGDTVDLVLQAITESVFDADVVIAELNMDLCYNPTVFVPLPQSGQVRQVRSDSVWLNIGLPGQEVISNAPITPLTTIRAVVALGDSDHSLLTSSNASITVKGLEPQSIPADTNRLNITNVFYYGNGVPRYINPLQGALELDISPNPVAGTGTITFSSLPSGKGALQVIDVMGQVVEDVSAQVRTGRRAFTVSSGGGTDITLMPGSYYVRLTVEGDQPNSYARIVRLFIVQ